MRAVVSVSLPEFASTEEAESFGATMDEAHYRGAIVEQKEVERRALACTDLQTKHDLALRSQLLRECAQRYLEVFA